MGIGIVILALAGMGILFAAGESAKAWSHLIGFVVLLAGLGLCVFLYLFSAFVTPIPYWTAIPMVASFLWFRFAQKKKFAKIAMSDED